MRARRDNGKLGQTTFTDFHNVKFIFVGEDANNTSKCTGLFAGGGFTFVVITVDILILLDLSYLHITVA